jgi:hypothetical protein
MAAAGGASPAAGLYGAFSGDWPVLTLTPGGSLPKQRVHFNPELLLP